MDENLGTIIIDNGSYMTKAGFAGHEAPRAIFPSIIGRPKHVASIAGKQNKDSYVGDEAVAKSGTLNLKYPIEHGIIANWEDIETIWHHTFYNELRTDPAEHTVLLTEKPMNTDKNREKMIQIMFETFNVSSFYLEMQEVLSLYSTKQPTGVVVESGESMTDIVAIKDGHPIKQSIITIPLGGCDVTVWLNKILGDILMKLDRWKTTVNCYSCNDIKEKCAYVALDYDKELCESKASHKLDKIYKYPNNGEQITLNDESFRAPEIMFKPHMNGFEFDGVDTCVFNSINKCDKEIQKDLYSNIITSGGNTLFPGFQERLELEIKKVAPERINVQVTRAEAKYPVWRGGSLLASSSSFPSNVILQDIYNDVGPEIINRKRNEI